MHTVITPPNIDRVRQVMLRSPQRSARQDAEALRSSRRSVVTILHKDLNFYSYKMLVVQELNNREKANRAVFCPDSCHLITRGENVAWPAWSPDLSVSDYFSGDTSSLGCFLINLTKFTNTRLPYKNKSQPYQITWCKQQCEIYGTVYTKWRTFERTLICKMILHL